LTIHDKVFYTNDGRDQVLLKTDWVAIVIATFGVAVVTYYGWSARNENPTMKKILYTLLVFIAVLWGLCAYILVSENR
jgi:arginine exporter protein ArgO